MQMVMIITLVMLVKEVGKGERGKGGKYEWRKWQKLDNTGFEPVTFHKAHLAECEAKIIPLDQLPWLILLRYWSKLGYIFVRSWVQAAQKNLRSWLAKVR